MKNRITQEDINFSRMFCFNSSAAPEQPEPQDHTAPEQPSSQGGEVSEQPGTPEIVPETPVPKESITQGLKEAGETWIKSHFPDYTPVTEASKPIASAQETPGATSSTVTSAATGSSGSNNGSQNRKPDISFEPVGNTGLTRMVVTDENGNKIPLEEAREKLGLTQENYEKIKNHNSIIDRSQETASNRMRDMWIRKGEKMSDWWKRLDDEQKMGLIGGGFLGGGLLLSNMNKKKRGLGDYISHYGIPAAIAGLSVYGGSAWNADENTYNLGRYNYLMDQAQQQQQNNTATA